VYRDGQSRKTRATVLVVVATVHILIYLSLTRQSRQHVRTRADPDSLLLLYIRGQAEIEDSHEQSARSANKRRLPDARNLAARKYGTEETQSNFSGDRLPEFRVPRANLETIIIPPVVEGGMRAPEHTPHADWEAEIEAVSKDSLAKLEKESEYRNFGGLSRSQTDWLRSHHMIPSPQTEIGNSLFSNKTIVPGVVRINDYCVLVNLLPYCSVKVGKRPVDGHLLDDMHKHLDELDVYNPDALP
jgi:hypothetical protein